MYETTRNETKPQVMISSHCLEKESDVKRDEHKQENKSKSRASWI